MIALSYYEQFESLAFAFRSRKSLGSFVLYVRAIPRGSKRIAKLDRVQRKEAAHLANQQFLKEILPCLTRLRYLNFPNALLSTASSSSSSSFLEPLHESWVDPFCDSFGEDLQVLNVAVTESDARAMMRRVKGQGGINYDLFHGPGSNVFRTTFHLKGPVLQNAKSQALTGISTSFQQAYSFPSNFLLSSMSQSTTIWAVPYFGSSSSTA